MNRLLSILVSLFVLFLVYLWINHITTDPWSTEDSPGITTLQESPPAEQPARNAAEESATEPREDESETPAATVPKPAEEASDATAPAAEESEPATNNSKTSNLPTNPERQHLVIAGNFLERANAETRVRELRNFGYSGAEVVNFQLSEYHTACAGRYADIQEARRVARQLKDTHHIDAYVRHGN